MIFYKSLIVYLVAHFTLFSSTTGQIDITVNVTGNPSSSSTSIEQADIEIGSFFITNHQSYPLTPEEQKRQYDIYNIFSSKDAFGILHSNSSLFGNLPRGTFLSLHYTLPDSNTNKDLQVSFKVKHSEEYALLPLEEGGKKIPIKVYLIDITKPANVQKPIELRPNQKYSLGKIEGKTLFMVIPKKSKISGETVDFNNYTLPLEVIYHAP